MSIQLRLTGICFLANGDGGYHGAYGHSNMRPEYASERSIGKREQKLGWDFFESEIDIIPRVQRKQPKTIKDPRYLEISIVSSCMGLHVWQTHAHGTVETMSQTQNTP